MRRIGQALDAGDRAALSRFAALAIVLSTVLVGGSVVLAAAAGIAVRVFSLAAG